MEISFIPIATLLTLSIYFSSKEGQRLVAATLLATSVIAFFVNEVILRNRHIEYNIRVDLVILIPLALVATSKIVFLRIAGKEKQLSSSLASSSLTFGFIGVVVFIIPVFSVIAIYKGKQALRQGATGSDELKANLGIILGISQIAIAIYLWIFHS